MANAVASPTPPRGSLWGDLRGFLFHRPDLPTLVDQSTRERQETLSESIRQRLGIDVTTYSVLNVHRIGIDVPCRFVFAHLLAWDAGVPYWPNRIARVRRVDHRLDNIEIHLFGWRRLFGLEIVPLFRLKAIEIRSDPVPSGVDNARFLLFTCEGGYPIGHFTMYLRSPIDARHETEPSQLFLAVGFNVYGRRSLSRQPWALPISRVWEVIHNRVTGNVLGKLKVICEKEFQELENGAGQPEAGRTDSTKDKSPVAGGY